MKNKYVSADGFVPKVTFANSLWQSILALVLWKPVAGLMALIVMMFSYFALRTDIWGMAGDIVNFCLIPSLAFLSWMVMRDVKRKEIRKHVKEVERKNI